MVPAGVVLHRCAVVAAVEAQVLAGRRVRLGEAALLGEVDGAVAERVAREAGAEEQAQVERSAPASPFNVVVPATASMKNRSSPPPPLIVVVPLALIPFGFSNSRKSVLSPPSISTVGA